ncbi:MAG: hypothetical protein OXF96_01720, partial [Chloroflexi bacterium]|nr:hypothetical protein [Chloroflexota bacterium]
MPRSPASASRRPVTDRAGAPADPSRRLAVMLGGAALGASVLGWRLYDWHVNQAADLAARGAGELLARTELHPRRGTIFDISGDVLAIERSAISVVADPSVVHEESAPFDIANRLEDILGLDPISVANAISNPRSRYALLARGILDDEHRRLRSAVAADELPGIRLEPDRVRVYPNGRLGSHVLGFLGERVDRPG